jgi:hypothetical protein
MKVAAIVPYRPEDPRREANWQCTRKQWEQYGWPVIAGDHEGEPFSRSRAINRATAQTDADVLCIADVDFLFGGPQAPEAAELAFEQCAHVVPFSELRVLGAEATYQVQDGEDPGTVSILETVRLVWVCAAMVSHELFDRVRGFDERFVGYGEEDLGFLTSTGTMGATLRADGLAYHLSHSEPLKDHPHRTTNHQLYARYKEADGNQLAMRAIIEERA